MSVLKCLCLVIGGVVCGVVWCGVVLGLGLGFGFDSSDVRDKPVDTMKKERKSWRREIQRRELQNKRIAGLGWSLERKSWL